MKTWSQLYITINIYHTCKCYEISKLKLSWKFQSFSFSFFEKPSSFQICLVWFTCNERHIEDLDIFSFSDNVNCWQCQLSIFKKKKNMAQSKRLELQTPGRPQNSWHKHVLWNFCNSFLALSCLYYSSILTLQGRLNSWPLSWIHLFDTHFWPTRTGQAACLVSNIPSPLRYKLYQNAAAPYKYNLSIDFFIPLN